MMRLESIWWYEQIRDSTRILEARFTHIKIHSVQISHMVISICMLIHS